MAIILCSVHRWWYINGDYTVQLHQWWWYCEAYIIGDYTVQRTSVVIILCSVHQWWLYCEAYMNSDFSVQSSSMVISPTWTEDSHVVSVSLLRAFTAFQLAVSGSSVNEDLTNSTCKSHAFSKSIRTTSEWPIWDAKWMGNIPSTPLFLTYISRVYRLFWNRALSSPLFLFPL